MPIVFAGHREAWSEPVTAAYAIRSATLVEQTAASGPETDA